jgi:hypothetical protein
MAEGKRIDARNYRYLEKKQEEWATRSDQRATQYQDNRRKLAQSQGAKAFLEWERQWKQKYSKPDGPDA